LGLAGVVDGGEGGDGFADGGAGGDGLGVEVEKGREVEERESQAHEFRIADSRGRRALR
jgi:hypothetical protein